jgi:hypothetical protein
MLQFNKFIIFAMLAVFIALSGCSDNEIPFEVPQTYLNLDTLRINDIKTMTYQTPPSMGNTPSLYFGSENGYNNLFSLVQIAPIASAGEIINIAALLDPDFTIDSLVFSITYDSDSIDTSTEFDIFYFPDHPDSIFSELSHYKNINEDNVDGAEWLSTAIMTQTVPESTETIFPELRFSIPLDNDFLNFFSDTTDGSRNRTIMIKEREEIERIISFKSRESLVTPNLETYYHDDDNNYSSTFLALRDITILEPASLTEEDTAFVTINRAKGLKSIIQISLDSTLVNSKQILIMSADLNLFLNDRNTEYYKISSSPLLDTVEVRKFWIEEVDEINVDGNVLLNDTLQADLMKSQLRPYLQALNDQLLDNLGLKLYSNINSDPFRSVHFYHHSTIMDSMNPYINVLYVSP